ncbi:hypothetical protein CC2G_010049 [Coprinopsis cinerea AmutBmut pab1-1]|nr:hypothetical protein CC2G_010049 [Coprinopsis cinerea AmutBmut pab1-1]
MSPSLEHPSPPVSRMPSEILSKILIAYRDEIFDPTVWIPACLQLCARWRHVAIGTPQLWSTIVFNLSAVEIKTFLERSKGTPLTIYVPFGMRDHLRPLVLKILGEHERIASLTIFGTGPRMLQSSLRVLANKSAPHLQELVLDGSVFFDGIPDTLLSGGTPNLRRVDLSGFTPRWTSPILHSNLTSLCIEECPYDRDPYLPLPEASEFLEAFARMPNLRQLKLYTTFPEEVDLWDLGEETVVPLLHLEELSLRCKSLVQCAALLEHFKVGDAQIYLQLDAFLGQEEQAFAGFDAAISEFHSVFPVTSCNPRLKSPAMKPIVSLQILMAPGMSHRWPRKTIRGWPAEIDFAAMLPTPRQNRPQDWEKTIIPPCPWSIGFEDDGNDGAKFCVGLLHEDDFLTSFYKDLRCLELDVDLKPSDFEELAEVVAIKLRSLVLSQLSAPPFMRFVVTEGGIQEPDAEMVELVKEAIERVSVATDATGVIAGNDSSTTRWCIHYFTNLEHLSLDGVTFNPAPYEYPASILPENQGQRSVSFEGFIHFLIFRSVAGYGIRTLRLGHCYNLGEAEVGRLKKVVGSVEWDGYKETRCVEDNTRRTSEESDDDEEEFEDDGSEEDWDESELESEGSGSEEHEDN